jgi:NTE family protein
VSGAAPVRRAVVLGAGGVLGFAWTLGALSAFEEVSGIDLLDMDVAVGTSAGSVVAGLLGCRLPIAAICRHHQGMPAPGDPVISYDYESGTGGVLPPRPGLRPAAPRLLLDSVRGRRRIAPMVALSGLLPAGRGTLRAVHDLIDSVAHEAGVDAEWPDRPRPWIVAADYRTGRRVVFGRDEFSPGPVRPIRTARLADAVTASCSIPAWYEPTVINGVPYIDGGTASNASVDVLIGTSIDEAFVFAPMASIDVERAPSIVGRLERAVRRSITKAILADVVKLRASGVRVHVITPVQADLEVMGLNLMDPTRRTAVLETAKRTAAVQLQRQFAARRAVGRAGSAEAGSSGGRSA